MDKALDVANYIIGNIEVDPLKLQKLLFYTQAVALVKHGIPAFSDPIEAWDYGPVVRSVYDDYKKYGYASIPALEGKSAHPDPRIVNSADLVIEFYGKKTGSALINETHSEAPWRNAYKKGQNTEITIETIKKYYKDVFVFDEE
jgi:uncharacterized phage-associated protein